MTWRTWLNLAVLSVLWGLPYMLVAVALEELPPVVIVAARVTLGAAVLVPLVPYRRLTWPRGRNVTRLLVVAVLDTVAPFLLIAVGQQAIPSALAGVLVATVPLFVVVLGRRLAPDDPVDGRRAAGFVIGFVGVVLLFGVQLRGGPSGALGALAVLAASACYAMAAVLIRRWFTTWNPVALTAAVCMIASILLAPVAALTVTAVVPSPRVLGAVVVLGTASTAGAFLLFYRLVQQTGAGRASLVTYLAPAVAVIAGVLFLREQLTTTTLLGLGAILVGSGIAGSGRSTPSRRHLVETRRVGARLDVGRRSHSRSSVRVHQRARRRQ